MNDHNDPWAVLGVARGASEAEIEAAWRALAKQYHPDANAGLPDHVAELLRERMVAINGARDMLLAAVRQTVPPRPQGHAHAPAPEWSEVQVPGPHECLICASGPTRWVAFSRQTGLLIFARLQRFEGQLCRDCALHVGRDMQSKTLWQGWWGIISFFRNWYYVGRNALELGRVRALSPPAGRRGHVMSPLSAPLHPGRPVFLRFGFLFFVAVAVWLSIAAATAETASEARTPPRSPTTSLPTPVRVDLPAPVEWEIGNCVQGGSMVRPVRCNEPHIGKIIARESSIRDCPQRADSFVERGRWVYCIDKDQ